MTMRRLARGRRVRKQWLTTEVEDGHVHVSPLGDLIEHDLEGECVCGPRSEPVPRDDGSMGWVVVHASLDGREALEG